MVIEVVFDVETQKLFSDIVSGDPGDLGVSVVSCYRRVLNNALEEITGEMKSFWHKDASKTPVISDVWPWFEEADRIIGFNSKAFDVPVLQSYYKKDFSSFPHFDILDVVRQKVGRKLSLNALAQETLGHTKIDVGTNAVYYWANRNEENLEKLRVYCEEDVRLTTQLYDFGRRQKQIRYKDKWNNEVAVDVDFSYPKKKEELQIGLF